MDSCPCGFSPSPVEMRTFSADWHRAHRDAHLAVFPDVDQGTRDNLELLITLAQQKERALT